MAEVLAEERNVSGLDGDVRTHGGHGDADPGRSEGRGVVDAIAHHGDGVSELTDDRGLVLGAEVGVDLGDAGLGSDRDRGAPVVAGEHDHP